jgi:hydroxymethylpyrimidine/phosphomethylpyrimidine kinase
MWGIKMAIEMSKRQPDVIYHRGDFGKEPMTIVFAKTPSLVIKKILRLFD